MAVPTEKVTLICSNCGDHYLQIDFPICCELCSLTKFVMATCPKCLNQEDQVRKKLRSNDSHDIMSYMFRKKKSD